MKPSMNGKLSACSLMPSQGQETEGKACTAAMSGGRRRRHLASQGPSAPVPLVLVYVVVDWKSNVSGPLNNSHGDCIVLLFALARSTKKKPFIANGFFWDSPKGEA